MKRSTNFRGRPGKHLTSGNLAALLERYSVKPNGKASEMQTFREAMDAVKSAKKKHPSLVMKVTVEDYGARIHGIMGYRDIERSVSWDDMAEPSANVLAICVGDIARELAALQPSV